ncbi:DUF317 domain-containing protein [Streptomyces sp. NBC_01310]|uniref:DUF317 domain-containing protein n=1 Tax=Streptomyces sp. NBC_01310 TaxID=2903820 RepID=UPI0035B62960
MLSASGAALSRPSPLPARPRRRPSPPGVAADPRPTDRSPRSRPLSIPDRHLARFAEDHDHLGSAVSPRHLAGPGDPRHITHVLRAAGWHTASDPLHPTVSLHSPDYSLRLTLTPKPGRPYRPWWRIRSPHGPAHWSAEFSGATPVEIIAGLTDALVQPPPEHLRSPWDVLTSHGWSHHRQSGGSESATTRPPTWSPRSLPPWPTRNRSCAGASRSPTASPSSKNRRSPSARRQRQHTLHD